MSENDFRAVFFEEAAEHLQTIEDELLTLDADPGDSEALNSVFRAAHSIKGSAGMFGFDTLAGFTHHLETLLDLVRKGQAVLDDDRVELTLQAVDEIRAIVDRLQDGQESPPADTELTSALVAAVATAQGGETASDDSAGADDDGFGLFEDQPEEPDESFGLFDDNAVQAPQEDGESGGEDDSFGLFTDHGVAADPDEDDGFGLFDQEASSDSAASDACATWFDEMFTGDDDQASPPAVGEQNAAGAGMEAGPGETGSTTPASRSDDPEADGGFGWLNRPDAVQQAGSPVPDRPSPPRQAEQRQWWFPAGVPGKGR
jgi:chemotaxis protein histidine kinase CheA